MKVIAPGKLVLSGAYAVLHGAPAIVVAVDRYAVVDVPHGGAEPAQADTRALYDEGGRKFGLGSSAASLVALHGARAMARGDDPRHTTVRAQIFRSARAEHAREQAGGSGVDIAASVHGGALRYALDRGSAIVRSVNLPHGLVLHAFWSGTSARTSDLLARVAALRERGSAKDVFSQLGHAARRAADAIGHTRTFVDEVSAFAQQLAALGRAADAPIVLPAFAELASQAKREGAAFLPSGAGGGDVAVWLGTAAPSGDFVARAGALSLGPLTLAIDHGGVRPESPS